METKIYKPTSENIKLAADEIKRGQVVAFPTETVYGLGAVFDNDSAIDKVFKIKGRPQSNPLIVHISNIDWLYKLTKEVKKEVEILIDKYWPGALTVILPKSDIVSDKITASLDSVAIRFPSNKIAQELIDKVNKPICAPSANLSGKPSPTTAYDVYNDLNGKIEMILDGKRSEIGVESTVIKIENNKSILLRPGDITYEELKDKIPNLTIDSGVINEIDKKTKVESPGMKFKHYAPKTNITLIESDNKKFMDYVNKNSNQDDYIVILNNEKDIDMIKNKRVIHLGLSCEEKEYNLYNVLREMDKNNIKRAFIQAPKKEGKELALYNRLIRAASFNIIKL